MLKREKQRALVLLAFCLVLVIGIMGYLQSVQAEEAPKQTEISEAEAYIEKFKTTPREPIQTVSFSDDQADEAVQPAQKVILAER